MFDLCGKISDLQMKSSHINSLLLINELSHYSALPVKQYKIGQC